MPGINKETLTEQLRCPDCDFFVSPDNNSTDSAIVCILLYQAHLIAHIKKAIQKIVSKT